MPSEKQRDDGDDAKLYWTYRPLRRVKRRLTLYEAMKERRRQTNSVFWVLYILRIPIHGVYMYIYIDIYF